MIVWNNAQSAELQFWNELGVNTFAEDNKQLKIYAPRLQLVVGQWFDIDFQDKTVIDIGSGPTSMLLKGHHLNGIVIDPLLDKFPEWVRQRYHYSGLKQICARGEDFKTDKADIVLLYNTLQHVENPEKLINNAKNHAKEIRVFEWINEPTDTKHIHTLTREVLDDWFGTHGIIERIDEENTFTDAWYSIIKI